MASSASAIIGKRTLKPVLWNLALQFCLLSFVIFLSSANIFHPFTWFYDWYMNLIWYGSCLYMIPLTTVVVLLSSSSSEDYVKIQPFYPTRISLLQQFFNLHNFTVGILHLLIGFLIPWTYSSLAINDGQTLIYECTESSEHKCLSERRFFFIMGGTWTGFLYFLHSHFFGTRYLKFPIVQLPKFILIKGQFIETLRNAIKWTFFPNLCFIVLYLLRGGSASSAFASIFGFSIEEKRIANLSGLFDLNLLIYLFTFSSIITITLRFMEMFSRVYLTGRLIFPFQPLTTSEVSLQEGLKMSDYPIMQHLAFLDLMLLSCHSKQRREEIFKLSSFGGHPHLWNELKESCSDMINDFINSLEESMSTPVHSITAEIKTHPLLRRNVADYFIGQNSSKSEFNSNSQLLQKSPTFFESFGEHLKKYPVVAYFFGSRKDMKIRHTLRLSLTVKWACECLSFLACFSIKEDKYGIVVNDLPNIIGSFLQLKTTLDHLLKQTTMASSLSRQDLENINEASILKKSVKRSIYRIVSCFKNYMSDLQLNKDIETQLMPFIMFKE